MRQVSSSWKLGQINIAGQHLKDRKEIRVNGRNLSRKLYVRKNNMQEVIRGAGSFKNVADKVVAAGYKSVLLVTGKHFDLSMYPFLEKSFQLNHFVKQGANVTSEEVGALSSFYHKHQNEVIMGIGGGT